jgi:hypothetical protein
MSVSVVMNVDRYINVVNKFLGRRAESNTEDATEIGGSKDRVA